MPHSTVRAVTFLLLGAVLAACSGGRPLPPQVEDLCIQHRAKAAEINGADMPNKDFKSLKLAHFILERPSCWDDETLATARARVSSSTPSQ